MSTLTEERPRIALGPVVTTLVVRVTGVAAILLVISVLTFGLLYLAPGDLVRTLIGTRPATPETIAAIREHYRLDDPVIVQYLTWLRDALHGDFGESIRMQQPVTVVVCSRLGVTVALCVLAFTIAVAVFVPLGVWSAERAGGAGDRVATLLAVLGVSAPSFVLGLLLLYAFAYYLPVFPVYGTGTGLLDGLYHLVLPATALAAGLGALLMRITRAAVGRELGSDYVTFLRSRGLAAPLIRRVVLRNATIPIVTGAGLILTYFVSGTILVETVFSLPGLGTLLQDSVLYKDIPVVQAVTLAIALVIAVVTVMVDISYAALDPRVRTRRGERA